MNVSRVTSFLAILVLAVAPAAAPACPLLGDFSLTWRQEAVECSVVVYGKLENARKQSDSGETDLIIEHVFKSDPAILAFKVGERVTVPRFLPIEDTKNPPRLLVFVDVNPKDGSPDIFRGVIVGRACVEYLQGLLARQDKPRAEQLRYCFDYLNHVDKEVADDARVEFVKADGADLAKAAAKLPPQRLRDWMGNDNTPNERLGLYARLLGYCGTEEDAKVVRDVLEKHTTLNKIPYLEELYIAYTMLKPADGWRAAHAAAADPASDFYRRYGALKAARFFLENKGVVCDHELLDTFAVLVDQSDIADMAIEYLGQAKCWKLTDRILAAATKKANNTPLMRRTVVRYALQCPDKAAAKYVAEQRKADPELVRDAEELLFLQADPKPNKP